MIFTEEFLKTYHACEAGLTIARSSGMYGSSYDEAIAWCHANNQEEFVPWLEKHKNTVEWIKSGDYSISEYSVGDTVYPDLQTATHAVTTLLDQYLIDYGHTVSIIALDINEEGNEVWTPIDMRTSSHSGKCKVFDCLTGQYETFDTIEQAYSKYIEMCQVLATNANSIRIKRKLVAATGHEAWEEI